MNVESSTKSIYAERNRRTGESRRRKTRAKLISAAIQVISERGVEAPVIDDFIQAADVSRGSFYNYFNTKDELLIAIADQVRGEMLRFTSTVSKKIADPAEQLVWGIRQMVRLAHRDHQMGLLLLTGPQGISDFDALVRAGLARTLRACMRQQRIRKQNVDVAIDLVIGVAREASRGAATGSRPKDHAEQVSFFLLCGLGMADEEAQQVAWRPMVEVVSDL